MPAIAVIGPTQTGKSTVVNVISGGAFVETSPLAAHTQRASLLALNTDLETATAAGWSYDGFEPAVQSATRADCPPCAIWDTPDFDSNAAAVYRQQVARVCALADLVVVVLSKEKYADQSVWRVLEIIAPLATPTLICLNKCEEPADDESSDTSVLLASIRHRLKDHLPLPSDTPVAALPRIRDGDLPLLLEQAEVQSFRRLVFDRLEGRTPGAKRAGLARLVRSNWAHWIEPVEAELALHREWGELLAGRTDAFLERYRTEYIDHTRHHDIAQKAILGLLELLEIPALAGPMSRARRALTWPFRKLMGSLGRPADRDHDQELAVLDAAVEHYLLSLRGEAAERPQLWWRALAAELAAREPDLRRRFHESVGQYRRAFQPRIDQLSEELYQQLQRNPVTLNALRAARVSADAGGIVLAVKTGALGLYDALFAPAVISLTSYLTESAVGQYLRAVIRRLKREQAEQITAIVRGDLEQPLRALQPRGPGLFGISREELDRAQRLREGLER